MTILIISIEDFQKILGNLFPVASNTKQMALTPKTNS